MSTIMSMKDIDKNFCKPVIAEKEDIRFYDPLQEPFSLEGLLHDEKGYFRFDREIADKLGTVISTLCGRTSGGCIRFRTDAKYISLICRTNHLVKLPAFPRSGQCGFDVYVDGVCRSLFYPEYVDEYGYSGFYEFDTEGMREIRINFPLFNDMESVVLGMNEDAVIEAPAPHKIEKTVAFYGSSITQGGCVSRPGLCYTNLLAQKLDFRLLNVGLSGNAKGQLEFAEFISKYDLAAFVMDYDHNAPDVEHLERTHEPFYKYVRERHPKIPVLILSKPDFKREMSVNRKRREIVRQTYLNALNRGENVYFIDGESLWGEADWDCCSADGCHPNDLGHYRMTMSVLPVLQEMLSGQQNWM